MPSPVDVAFILLKSSGVLGCSRGSLGLVVSVLLLFAGGCSSDPCRDTPPSFQLDLRFDEVATFVAARSLKLVLGLEEAEYSRVYALDEGITGDGATSLVVELSPPPSHSSTIRIAVEAWDGPNGDGKKLGSAEESFSLFANGCNLYRLSLEGQSEVTPGPDASPDAGVEDVGEPSVDAATPDGGEAADVEAVDAEDAQGPDVDAGETADADGSDTGAPDASGVPVFAYDPTLFDPEDYAPSDDLLINCNLTFDTSGRAPEFPGCDGTPGPKVDVVDFPALGRGVVVVSTLDLIVADGAKLRLVGDRAVVFAVYGDAAISGTIDASPHDGKKGAGSDDHWYCDLLGQGSKGSRTGGGGTGGGGGGLGSDGGSGGSVGTNGGGAGGVRVPAHDVAWSVIDPRGGCRGGDGAQGNGAGGGDGGKGGAGGGSVQISASGRFTLEGIIAASGAGGGGGAKASSGGTEADGYGGGGGGGGGSGGSILIEANDIVIDEDAAVIASGGGGGKGGSSANGGGPAVAPNGASGFTTKIERALGGDGSGDGGDGGKGGAGDTNAENAENADGDRPGGGGGGGSVGWIRLRRQNSCTVHDEAIVGPPPWNTECD